VFCWSLLLFEWCRAVRICVSKSGVAALLLLGFFAIHFLLQEVKDAESFLRMTIWYPVFLVGRCNCDKDSVHRCEKAFLLSCLVQSCYALLQGLEVFHSNNGIFPMTGSFSNPGPLGGYLAVGLVLLFSRLKDWRYSPVWLIGGVVLFILIVLSNSRAAWLATIIGMSVCFIVKWKFKKVFFAILVAFLIMALLFYFVRPESADGRVLIWKICLNNVNEYWMFGCGADGFQRNYMNWQGMYFDSAIRPESEMTLACDNTHCFNSLLHFFVEYGLLGIFVLLLIVSRLKYNPKNATFVSCLVAWMTFSFFSYPEDVLPLFVILPFVVGLNVAEDGQIVKLPQFVGKTIFPIIAFLFFALTILLLYVNVDFYMSLEKYAGMNSIAEYEKVNREPLLLRNNIRWRNALAETTFQMGLYDDAIVHYKKSILLQPMGDKYIKFGECYWNEKDLDNALECFKCAEKMLPAYATPVYDQFCVCRERGDSVQAELYAEKLLSMPIKVASPKVSRMKSSAEKYLESMKCHSR